MSNSEHFNPEKSERPKPKFISQIQLEELEEYLAVPGWRVWESIGALTLGNEEYDEALKAVETKPKVLHFSPLVDRKPFDEIGRKYERATGRIVFPNPATGVLGGRVSLVLEPLTEEEVRRIDEDGQAPGPLGSIDKPEELIRPSDLRNLFTPDGKENASTSEEIIQGENPVVYTLTSSAPSWPVEQKNASSEESGKDDSQEVEYDSPQNEGEDVSPQAPMVENILYSPKAEDTLLPESEVIDEDIEPSDIGETDPHKEDKS